MWIISDKMDCKGEKKQLYLIVFIQPLYVYLGSFVLETMGTPFSAAFTILIIWRRDEGGVTLFAPLVLAGAGCY